VIFLNDYSDISRYKSKQFQKGVRKREKKFFSEIKSENLENKMIYQ
jgi:predicted TIM-barrel fold metal-dependent hydrolase